MESRKFLKDLAKEEQNFLKAPIYLYGTEAIGSYYKALGLKGKTILTVCGSGDQVLNAYYFGAKKVKSFDLAKEAGYMLDLKIASIKRPTHKEFLNFFGDKSGIEDFSYDTYCSLKGRLEENSIKFFDELFEKVGRDGKKLLEFDNFRERKEFYVRLDEINPFLASKESYVKMRRLMKDVDMDFVEANVSDVAEKIKGRFDVINLSNVLNYISREFVHRKMENPLASIYRGIILKLRSRLNTGGKIIFYRFYRSPEEFKNIPLINLESSSEWIEEQGDFDVSSIEFDGILHGMDAINILEIR